MSHVRISYETFQKTAPGAQAALLAMGKTVDESGLEKQIVELVKLHVSQINNCAFCLQIHLNVARKLGVAPEKLDLVATWHEAGIFSEREGAALAWAETLTRLADRSPAFATQIQTLAQQANIQTGGIKGEINVSGEGKVDQAAGVNTGTMTYQARDDKDA